MPAGNDNLWVERGGAGGPALLLVHGMGANATVWYGLRPFVEANWPGRWLAPDLRGHGRSPHRRPYGFATFAADLATLFAQGEEIVVAGHSMGGAVAMALATGWFGVRVRAVVALGVKLVWRDDEIQRAAELAAAPVRWFDTREEAVARYLKVAGLSGLVPPDAAANATGVAEADGLWRMALDPAANAAAGPPIDALCRAAAAPVRLAAGANDPMVTAADMRRLDADAVVLDGLGHNAHVEDPQRVWRLIANFVGVAPD